MTEEILLLLSPFVVNLLVSGMKSLKTVKLSDHKKGLLRLGVVISSIGLMAASVIAGGNIDIATLESLVTALMIGLASQGSYFLKKKAEEE